MEQKEIMPLYKNIYNDIKDQIESGVLAPGDRIMTETEISEAYGVSRITATRAVRELQADGYIFRVRKRGSIVNPPEKYRESRNSKTVIPIVLPFDMDVSLDICDGAQRAALAHGYTVAIYNSAHSEQTERDILQELLQADTGGFVVWPVNSFGNLDVFANILLQKKPLVFLDFPKAGIDAPCISIDNCQAVCEITSYVIEKGHRAIAFYGTSIGSRPTEAQRFRGYVEALIAHGIVPREEYMIGIPKAAGAFEQKDTAGTGSEARAEAALAALMSLPEPPTAVICINDTCATYLEKAALKMGIAIPQALSITGFDNRDICSFMPVPITSVRQDFHAIGKAAAELIHQLQQGQPIALPPIPKAQIIPRESVSERGADAAPAAQRDHHP